MIAQDQPDTCFISFFEESDLFLNTLLQLLSAVETNSWLSQHNVQMLWISNTIDKYQEQPQLLDPHLQSIIDPCITLLKTILNNKHVSTISQLCNQAGPIFKILYLLSKARGYKTIIKFFSHDVCDLEPILEFTEFIAYDDLQLDYWETPFILLVWLSLLVMIPFDLVTVDSNFDPNQKSITIMSRILKLAKHYMFAVGREYEAASLLLMRVVTRHDVAHLHLNNTIKWAFDSIKISNNTFELRGILYSLCKIYKNGERSLLLPTLDKTSECLMIFEKSIVQNNSLLRKLATKLCQRLGLCYMKPRVAKWRYERGFRSLVSNLAPDFDFNNQHTNSQIVNDNLTDEEKYDDIPDVIENILDILIQGLSDKDTIVRWTCAKGIGRITNRLPKSLANDVVEAVISILAQDVIGDDISGVSDAAWGGSCLAVAELSRRGLLLPEKLTEAVPWIVMALTFDQKKGSHSIGSHVRDAACYVFWSFARAYEASIMKPFVSDMANALVIVSVFDREINIRRASSAAFQENVGRQGAFPHGIDIITCADYFSVGNRSNAFLEVSLEIAQYSDYTRHMIDHLTNVTIVHWDKSLRELASQALHKLSKLDIDYIFYKSIPALLKGIRSRDLVVRHGSILGLGEVCLAFSSHIPTHEFAEFLKSKDATVIDEITSLLDDYPKEYLESFGSDINRLAISRFIECLSLAKWPITNLQRIGWFNILKSSIERKDEALQIITATSIGRFSETYGISQEELKLIIEMASSPSHGIYKRRGFALALGEIDVRILNDNITLFIEGLIKSMEIYNNPNQDDAETRRNAVNSLTKNMIRWRSSSKDLYEMALKAYFIGLDDYSIDSRGDVGSWIREASINGLEAFILSMYKNNQLIELSDIFNSGFWIKYIGKLCRQSVEKIDRMRETAGKSLHRILWMLPSANISGIDELKLIFTESMDINWLNPSEVYPLMINVLLIPEYRVEFLCGIISSVGGLTENLVRQATACLLEYLNQSPQRASDFLQGMLDIFILYPKMERISIPFLETLDLYFGCVTLLKESDGQLYQQLFLRVTQLMYKVKDAKKLLTGLKVLSGMASLDCDAQAKKSAIKKLCGYLIHPFPLVRRTTAEYLYFVKSVETTDDRIEDILLNTNWDDAITELKPIKELLTSILDI